MTYGAKPSSAHSIRTAGALIVLASVAMLVGCQGVSAGNSSQPPNGDLSFATMALNFGSVAAGTSKTMTVSATNSGTKAVTVNSAAMTNICLAAPSLPVVVGPGQSTTLSVKFTPNSAGTFSGTVSVSSDAANAVPAFRLAVRVSPTGNWHSIRAARILAA